MKGLTFCTVFSMFIICLCRK
uniref:Uncharacterized protein n=1 Tax=Anguilla anguilla TaxID=7936 RepID=A0A0E9TUT4_ANGAN